MRSISRIRIGRFFAGCLVVGLIARLAESPAQQPTPPMPTTVFKGHTEPIYSVAYSPDGKLVVTASFDKSVRLWDASTGKTLREMSGTAGHQNIVLSVGFNAAGDSVASGGSDNFARVWDIPVNTPVRELIHAAGVNGVAVTVDGKTIAGACKDGTIKLWNAADGKQTGNLVGHPGGATGVAFTTNGQLLASVGVDGTLRYWNPANGQQLGMVGAHGSAVEGVGLHPNNNSVYTIGDDGFLKFWQLPPVASRVLPAHADGVTGLFTSTDGNIVLTSGADKVIKQSNYANGQLVKDYTGAGAVIQAAAMNANTVAGAGADGKLYLWNPADGKLAAQLVAHTGGVTDVAFHPSQPVLATVGADGLLKTWSLPTPAPRSIKSPDRVLAAVLSADGKRLFTAGADKIVRSWTFATGAAERQFTGHTGLVTALAVSADGNTLISAGADETIRFWNTQNSTQTASLSGHVVGITSLALNPQGNLLVSGGEDGSVKIWQLPAAAAKPHAHPDAVLGLALSLDGNRALTIGNDKQARLWNLANGQMERAHNAGTAAIAAIAISPDNATLAIAGTDKSLSLWNAGKEVKTFPPLPVAASAIAFNANGSQIAIGGADNSLRLFNTADTKEIKALPGHAGAISALMYSPKGDLLISASADKTVRLWNAADGAAKGQFTHPAPITALAISKDGSRLAAGGTDKTISMWTLADNKPAGTVTTTAEVRGISLSPDGQKLAVAGADNKVRVFGNDGKLQEIFLHDGAASGVAFLPDGKRIVSCSADKTMRLWTSAYVAQGAHMGPVRQVYITPQSDRVFSCGDDKHLRIFDPKTGKESKAIAAHDGAVVGFSLSTDLAKVATAGADKSAKVWTVADGKAVTTIALGGPAQAVALSPNGTRLAVAFADADAAARIRSYDAANGRELQAIADPAAPTHALSFLADNRTLLSAGDDKQVSVNDASVAMSLPVNTGGVAGVAWHPNGSQIMTAGKDKSARLWDVAQGKEVKAYGPLPDPIAALAVSRDFALVGVAAGKTAKVWQIADAKEIATITHPAEVVAIQFNADKSRLITGTTDNMARVWEVATGRLLQTFSHGAAVRGVAFHPSQPTVITASADKTVLVNTQSIVRAIPASPNPLRAMAVTPNGSHVITGGDDKNVKAWNTGNGADERTFAGAEGPVHAVAISKNAQVLAAAGADKKIRVYTFADAKLIGTIDAPAGVRGLAFHPNNRILAGVCDDKSVNAWNVVFQPNQPLPPEFGRPIQSFAHAEPAQASVFSDQGGLFTASGDKSIKEWRIASDTPTNNFQHPNLVDSVAFDSTNKLLATGCHDGVLRTWDLQKNAVVKTINAHTQPQANPIYSVTWTPDNKNILTASYDRSLKLWDANSGNMVREFKAYTAKTFEKGHRDQVFCAAFNKAGNLLATGSSDKGVKLWDVSNGNVVREFSNPNLMQPPAPASPDAHPGWVYAVRFSPDDKYLITAGSAPKLHGYLAVWNAADGKMLYGQVLPYGPIYSLAVSKDGKQLLLGCGARDRMQPASEALVIPMPVK